MGMMVGNEMGRQGGTLKGNLQNLFIIDFGSGIGEKLMPLLLKYLFCALCRYVFQ